QTRTRKEKTGSANAGPGEKPLGAVYRGYKDFGDPKSPTRVVGKQGDYPIGDLTVPDVNPNAPANIQAPPAGGGGGGQPPATTSRQLGDGVYLILGGYASIAVDFKDYIVLIEGGNSEAGANADNTEA